LKNKLLDDILNLGAVKAAPKLLGWTITRNTSAGTIKIKIVETEAYLQNDAASHSYRGMTKRTAPMFEAGGHLYVYFTYGMHYCMNIVVGPKGRGEAVLIRAGEPLAGIEIIQENRGTDDISHLAKGPACLAQALGIKDTSLSGKLLNRSSIYLEEPQEPIEKINIVAASRIGIHEEIKQPWRFYIKDNPFVSRG
jgi:DNA-3-methyladenine glycosylase